MKKTSIDGRIVDFSKGKQGKPKIGFEKSTHSVCCTPMGWFPPL
jgi:hypothetical protein